MRSFLTYIQALLRISRKSYERAELTESIVTALIGLVLVLLAAWGLITETSHSHAAVWIGGVGFILLFFFMAPFRVYLEHQKEIRELEDRLADGINRRSVRDALTDFMTEGKALLVRCDDLKRPAPSGEEAGIWVGKVSGWLEIRLEKSYAGRFNDPSDIPLQTIPLKDEHRRNLYQAVRFRLARLNEFIKEFR